MALSGRELTLILRARDEASRTLGRLSSGMSKLDRDAQRISASQVRASQRNLVSLRRDMHDIEEAYQRQTLAAREQYYASNRNANAQRRYQSEMLNAQKMRVDQLSQNRLLRQQQEDFIDGQREHLRLLAEERDAQRHYHQNLIASGTAAVAFGAAVTYAGVRGVEAFASTIQASMDYQQQVARTTTQVDKAGASLQQISDIGKDVAREVPVAFEEIQPALYDIFSSIDTNAQGARMILKQFAQDAVGGQVDMATATKANLAIMNAYNLKAEDSAKVSDFMFRLVQKGVGTYEDFAKTIGRAIPSAARAGQTYQTLGAMLAFMTRNGVSAAMAASSSARALDAMSNPKVVGRLEDMGVKVKDIHGEFLPLPDVLGQMQKKFEGLTRPELSKKLQALFLGAGGTIQARRFFDMYFKNSDEFNKRVGEMADNAGQAQKAFDQMADTPQAKLQKLKNDWMLLRIEIGENLMPVAMKIVGWADEVVRKFQSLSPETKRTIEILAALGTAITVLIGILTMLMGSIMVIRGGFGILRASMAESGTTAGKLTAKYAALAAGMILVADGISRMSQATTDGQRDLAGFEQIGGGALMGFAAGGPIGAALGATAGALSAIATEARNSKNEAQKSIGTWQQYAATLDQVTAATTGATKAMIYDNLVKSGTLKTLAPLGLSQGTLLKALMGQKGASDQAAGAIKILQGRLVELNREVEAAGGHTTKTGAALEGQIGIIEEAIKAYQLESGAVKESTREQEKRIAVLHDIPTSVVTKLRTEGVPKSMKEWSAFIKQQRLTPKQVKSTINLAKADLSKKQLKELQDQAARTKKKFDDLSKGGGGKGSAFSGIFTGITKDIKKAVSNAQSGTNDIKRTVDKGAARVKPDFPGIKQGVTKANNAAKSAGGSGAAGIGSAVKSGFGHGFAGAILSWSSQVAAAVHAAIAAGRKAAGAHSPSKETEKLGNDMIDGMVLAFKKNGDKPPKEASKLVKKILQELSKNILHDIGTEGFKVSVGKVLDVARDFIDKKLDGIAKHLKGKAKKAFEKSRGAKVKSFLKDVTDATAKDVKRLEKINQHLKQVRKDLDDANDALQTIKDTRASFAASATEYASLSGLSLEVVTVGTISTAMHKRIADLRAFKTNLAKLKRMGFTQAVIDEILSMPIPDAIAYAAALVQATPGQMKDINTMTSQAIGLGTQIASQMYDAGVKAAQSLVDGLKSQEKDLEAIAQHLGHLIAVAIKKELKMKSPSKVALEISRNFGSSLGAGLMESERPLTMISSRLATAMQPSPSNIYTRRPVVGSGNTNAGGPNKVVHQTLGPFYVQEQDPRAWAQKAGWHLANRTGL